MVLQVYLFEVLVRCVYFCVFCFLNFLLLWGYKEDLGWLVGYIFYKLGVEGKFLVLDLVSFYVYILYFILYLFFVVSLVVFFYYVLDFFKSSFCYKKYIGYFYYFCLCILRFSFVFIMFVKSVLQLVYFIFFQIIGVSSFRLFYYHPDIVSSLKFLLLVFVVFLILLILFLVLSLVVVYVSNLLVYFVNLRRVSILLFVLFLVFLVPPDIYLHLALFCFYVLLQEFFILFILFNYLFKRCVNVKEIG